VNPPSRSHDPRRRTAGGSRSPGSVPNPPAEFGLASAVWRLMSDFVRSHDPADDLRRELGLGRGAGRVKALISLADGPLSLAELARAIGADASYTTILVNELQALGLVSRTLDSRDHRRKAVELTADGHDAMRKAQDIISRPPPALLDLPAADLVRLRETLGQLSGA
jgi:DNA-binding MarR family transcriptional regulator